MKPADIKRLFKLKSGCTLVIKDGREVMSGSFQEMLTQYYMSYPWKMVQIRLPMGNYYPGGFK